VVCYYGIRLRLDNYWIGPNCLISADTVLKTQTGISYTGRIHLATYDLAVTNCVLNSGNPISGSGISTSSSEGLEQYWPTIIIEGDSISGFYNGVYLNQASQYSMLRANRIKSNGTYGLYLASSSPTIQASLQGVPNIFRKNKIGINCDPYSHPIVTNTVFRDHSSRSVVVETHDNASIPLPDLSGPNTFTQIAISTGFYYIENINLEALGAIDNTGVRSNHLPGPSRVR
jgi:hypothetical protein